MNENNYKKHTSEKKEDFAENRSQNSNVIFDVNVFTVDFLKGLSK